MLDTLKTLLRSSSHEEPLACPIDLDEAIDVLSANRRRLVIKYLANRESETSIRELSEHIAKVESTDRKSVYTTLHQLHLEKLHDTGVVSWDRRSGTVKKDSQCDVLYRVLRQAKQELAH
ncbi:hypothetical protein ACFQE1_00445 [Halobium palmae]|uniref:DUF7344 domain-containing protein n=1 Tax=Halobium palmae TaxID=1776492 RepID=A0ABD5RU01_9EURY